jgi:hypothetical protein
MQSNKRMQSDRSTRYASETAVDAERYGLKESMKYVYKATTIEGANEIKTLLENAGIPAPIMMVSLAKTRMKYSCRHSLISNLTWDLIINLPQRRRETNNYLF